MAALNFATIISPLGPIGIYASSTHITEIKFLTPSEFHPPEKKNVLIQTAQTQLREYFTGNRAGFELPLAPNGTKFQQKVWQALRNIPYGQTRTYKEIAAEIGNPNAYRAVGTANNKNPIAVVIPCHRVIGSSGKLVGYAGGLEKKDWLLKHESAHLE